MSCDKLVYDLAMEAEGTPSVFVRKDWLSILDNQNGNYNSNTSVIETSSLSNNNKFMNYREAYLSIPMLITLSEKAVNLLLEPATAATSLDTAVSFKSWFGNIIHSMTLDVNGVTVIQQTPFINMWNNFQLLTTFSWGDVESQGSTIGFYPDDPDAWRYEPTMSPSGIGVCNNLNRIQTGQATDQAGAFFRQRADAGNVGLWKRQLQHIYDPAGVVGTGATFSTLQTTQQANNLYRGYIFNKTNKGAAATGRIQHHIMATVPLKQLHSFWNNIPLCKGLFCKLTLTLNNSSCEIKTYAANHGTAANQSDMELISSTNAVGGVFPLMITSTLGENGGKSLIPPNGNANAPNIVANVSVGRTCTDNAIASLVDSAPLSQNIFLYVPSYVFNPIFEQSYLSSPVKQIKYTDVYQYQLLEQENNFNHLVTNGIAGIKSILIVPFHSRSANLLPAGVATYQSPFDSAGCGTTSPLSHLSNFNVVVSGQNVIYNTQKYGYEQYLHNVYGANAVNGGMVDGLTSGLISKKHWESNYCYYYVDLSRMLPVVESVPKSVSIVGDVQTTVKLDLMIFIEYAAEISIDVLTGTRV